MKKVKRYLRVYKVLLRLNLAQLLAYRANLINSCISHTIWGMFGLMAMFLLTSKNASIFGWTRNELLVIAATYNIVFGVFYGLFQRSFVEFSNTIHFGRLDSLLTKPIDSQFLLTSMYISYTHIIRLCIGFVFLGILLTQMQISITFWTILSFLLVLGISVLFIYSLWFLVLTITIWFTKLTNLVELLFQINGVTRFPPDVFKEAGLVIFLLCFPLSLIVIVPAKTLLQKLQLSDVGWLYLLAVITFYFSRLFWKYALRSYTSASG